MKVQFAPSAKAQFQERLNAGGTTTSAERMVAAFTTGAPVNSLTTDTKPLERGMLKDSPSFVNSEAFANEFIKTLAVPLSA